MIRSLAALLIFSALAGCGPEPQGTVGSPGSAHVNLNITMPANVAAVSMPQGSLWAKVQQWFLATEAWAATAADLSALQVEVTAPDLPAPLRKGVEISTPLPGGAVVEAALDVPVGADRVFTVNGLDRQGRQVFRGQSPPITLVAGRAESIQIALSDNTTITGAITGTVINATTQAPINGARVQLGGAISAVTAEDGQFILTEVPQGAQTLRVSASGFNEATQAVTVVAGQTVSTGPIALTLRNITGTITGRILSDGDSDSPVVGATVVVLNTTPPLSVSTGADGRFTLTGVSQGAKTLQVSASGFNAATKTVTVVVGQTVSAGTIALIPIPTTGTVTGSIFTEGNADDAVAGATITVLNTTPPLSGRTGTNGRFTLRGVPQGAQTLRVSAQGFNDATQPVTVVAGQSVSTGPIALKPFPITGRVTGTVTNATTNEPLNDASVAVTGTTNSTDTQPDGSFTLDGVLQGSQTLRVRKQGFNDATKTVTVVAGQSVSAGTIALTSTTGSITGTVINADTQAAIQGATVAVNGLSLSTTSNSDGSFTLDEVPQGSQTLRVSQQGFNDATKAVTVIARTSISAGTITLTSIPPPTTGTITGTIVVVVGEQSAPVPNATVTLHSLQENLFATTTTDSDGNFTFPAIPQGPQTLTVKDPLFVDVTKAVTVVAGASVSTGTIALTPNLPQGSITGTVINAKTNAPLGNVLVSVPRGVGGGATDSTGDFVVGLFPQGPLTLTFSKGRFITTTKTVTVFGGLSVSIGTIALEPVQ